MIWRFVTKQSVHCYDVEKIQITQNTNTNIEEYKYKYCHQAVWCQESLKINGVDSVCSEKNAQQLHFMETTPDTTAVKISEKLQPMQFLNFLVRDTFVPQSLGSDN